MLLWVTFVLYALVCRCVYVQKAVTRAVTETEHKLALAKEGRTAELFRSHAHTDIRVRL